MHRCRRFHEGVRSYHPGRRVRERPFFLLSNQQDSRSRRANCASNLGDKFLQVLKVCLGDDRPHIARNSGRDPASLRGGILPAVSKAFLAILIVAFIVFVILALTEVITVDIFRHKRK